MTLQTKTFYSVTWYVWQLPAGEQGGYWRSHLTEHFPCKLGTEDEIKEMIVKRRATLGPSTFRCKYEKVVQTTYPGTTIFPEEFTFLRLKYE